MEINSLKNQKYSNGLPAIWVSTNKDVVLAEADKLYNIDMNIKQEMSGDGFFFGIKDGKHTNGIQCLKNGYVIVSCELMAGPRSGYIQMSIYVNNRYICCFNTGKTNFDYGNQCMPPKLVRVNAGDIINMKVQSTLAGDKVCGDERTGITAFYIHID